MNKRTIESELLGALESTADLPGLKKVKTFSDSGLLTTDNGLVLSFQSGEQFQVTIKRSK